nr:hypothetical protein GCM10020185_06840 [Pseudomonas brassicacearum subsp. brassicacearum]
MMIGNGMAGVRTLEELLKLSNELYDITVFGAEPHTNYNRILLSPVLAGEQTFEEIVLNDLSWYLDNNIKLLLNRKVVEIDRVKRRVIAEDGSEAEYDRLLIATGSTPFILPIPGNTLEGVIGYRDIADTQAMINTAKTHKHAVVIGGGLLGLEAANGLKLRGMDVTVVHLGEWLLERQLDKTSGQLLQTALENRGLKFRLSEQTQALHDAGNGRVGSVQFKNGDIIPADLVVMAAGIRPNTELAEKNPASRATAGSWSTTRCKPTTRASTPLVNAPATVAPPTAWWRRCSNRPRSAPTTSRNWASPLTRVRSPRPS